MNQDYNDFIRTKIAYMPTKGIPDPVIHDRLFPFQKSITEWACKRGRAAIFAECGLGKSFCQLVWADNAVNHSQGKVIIFAPLSVNCQTIQEGVKLGIKVARFDDPEAENTMIHIANYEQIDNVDCRKYHGIVCDESSVLKSLDGKTKTKLIDFSSQLEYRLACTATPAPNDISELCNHVEFLGIMKREEMLSKWFYNNGKDWQLKGHAVEKFWEWVSTWGIFVSKPSDLNYSDEGYELPPLNINPIVFDFQWKDKGTLFDMGLSGIEDRIAIRGATVDTKGQTIADMVNASPEQWIVWCGINKESDEMHRLIPDSENLQGSDSPDQKVRKIQDFISGKIRVLVTKCKIAGFGLNFQHCSNMVFFGIGDSYEMYHQAIRRCFRFGQTKPVNVHVAVAGNEMEIFNNVLRKEQNHNKMQQEIIMVIKKFELEQLGGSSHQRMDYATKTVTGNNYTAHLGDSCEIMKQIPDESIDFSIFSPPFSSLYTYTNSERDLGNSNNDSQFFEHFGFITKELLRIIKPGRLVAVHCMNLPTLKHRDGFIGIRDFRGDIIRHFQSQGFIFHAEVTIDKNPQAAAIRTRAKGLMFKQLEKDSSESRQGIPDNICIFKKHGENLEVIKNDVSREEWNNFANPIWYDIRETYTLNSIKADKDEKHICPLQLDAIDRCVRLWSNKGDTVFSPFMGIGSEGYQSLLRDRKFIGIELKPEYFAEAVKNLDKAAFKAENVGGFLHLLESSEVSV